MSTSNKRAGAGGDMVLESRQLLGVFFLLVVALGVVFTLGYLLARSQYDPQFRSAVAAAPVPAAPGGAAPVPVRPRDAKVNPKTETSSTPKVAPAPRSVPVKPPPPPRADWDFYHSGEPEKPADKLIVPQGSQSAGNSGASGLRATTRPPTTREVRTDSQPSGNRNVPARLTAKSSGKPMVSPLIPRGATVLQVAAVVRQADALVLAQTLQRKRFPAFVVTPADDRFYRVQVGPYPDAKSANAARQRLEKQGFNSIVKR